MYNKYIQYAHYVKFYTNASSCLPTTPRCEYMQYMLILPNASFVLANRAYTSQKKIDYSNSRQSLPQCYAKACGPQTLVDSLIQCLYSA